ncbi:glycosyltransferase family 52 protein [Gammaproteobacteria bacterium]|nr:glycosyltransferase family 52 protein [Gammaproteobacteria bacterium]
MSSNILFFCKTPLQALIINRLIDNSNSEREAYVIYIPNNHGSLHKIYFDKINATKKFFLDFSHSKLSDSFSHLINFHKLPKFIRRNNFKRIYFSSIGDIVLSLLLGRNKDCQLHLFADGAFNLEETSFMSWISSASSIKKIIIFFFKGEKPLDSYKKLSCYHTISPISFSNWMNCPVKKVNLFNENNQKKLNKDTNYNKLRVLIGSYFSDEESELEAAYHKAIKNIRTDIHIPHPGNNSESLLLVESLEALSQDNCFECMIAEEIVLTLLNQGYKIYLYGFSSTVLFNMSNLTPTISIALDVNSFSKKELFKKAKIKVIKGYQESNIIF